MKIIEGVTGVTEKTIKIDGSISAFGIEVNTALSELSDQIMVVRKSENSQPVVLIPRQPITNLLPLAQYFGRQNMQTSADCHVLITLADGDFDSTDKDYLEVTVSNMTSANTYSFDRIDTGRKAAHFIEYANGSIDVQTYSKEPLVPENAFLLSVSNNITKLIKYTQSRSVTLSNEDLKRLDVRSGNFGCLNEASAGKWENLEDNSFVHPTSGVTKFTIETDGTVVARWVFALKRSV